MDKGTTFLDICDKLIEEIDTTSKHLKSQVRELKNSYKKDMRKRNNRKPHINTDNGFNRKETVPEPLTKLLNIRKDTTMTRVQVTKLVYRYFKDRALFYDKDKRVLRADSKIKKLFNLTDKVNQSTDPKDKSGLNFYNLQTHIAKLYK